MKSGRVNSDGSLATAGRVFREFGESWKAVEQASRREPDGVHVIRRPASPHTQRPVVERHR